LRAVKVTLRFVDSGQRIDKDFEVLNSFGQAMRAAIHSLSDTRHDRIARALIANRPDIV
jgi:hypothetical protein